MIVVKLKWAPLGLLSTFITPTRIKTLFKIVRQCNPNHISLNFFPSANDIPHSYQRCRNPAFNIIIINIIAIIIIINCQHHHILILAFTVKDFHSEFRYADSIMHFLLAFAAYLSLPKVLLIISLLASAKHTLSDEECIVDARQVSTTDSGDPS